MSTALRLLILEDDAYDAELDVTMLEEAGYDCQWERVETQAEFLARLDALDYDLILADYNLPTFDGLTALELFLERDLDLPFILVSGTLGEETAIESLKAGATDYVLKDRLSRLGPMVRRALREREEHRQRKRAEEALRESEALLNKSQAIAHIGSWELDLVANRLTWSDEVYRMFGLRPQEFDATYEAFLDTVHPDDRAAVDAAYSGSLREGRDTYEIEHRIVRRDSGEVRVVHEKCEHVKDASGRIVRSVGMVQDITERKQAEEEILRLNQFLDSVIDNANVWLDVLDEKGNVVLWNKAAEEISGYSREEVVGHGKIWEWNYPDEEYRSRIFAKVLALIEKGEYKDGTETTIRRKDGQTRVISWHSRRLMDEKGTPIGAIVLGHDITERKQLEAQLRQAQKMEAIGQLAGGIAHDFNNLLTPIGGFAELLLGKAPEGSQQQEYLLQIQVAAERAAGLTRQLRLFTRQTRGERHPVQLNSVVEETRDLLERSIPKDTIELHLASELWVVEADPSQISQVLMNLCLNAHDAMPDGGTLTLKTGNVILDEEYARTVLEAQPGRYVCLSVSDTGCGMSPEVQARLFEPFFTTKGVGKGTGLGLSVVYGIVKGHGGFIQVYSEEGRGSTFHVYLPAVEWAVEERGVEGLELPTGTEIILLVDDEEMVRALGQGVLEHCGYTVLVAEEGVQALELYQAHRGEIALVVLDVIMPQMGGQECLRRLREMDPEVRVLISTGYTARGLAEELVAEGALGVVEKPFRLQDFATAVRAALDES